MVWTDGINPLLDSVSSLTFCASPGPAVKFSQTDESNAGAELLPVVPGGRTVAVLHHLLPQHGAQLHQQDPLWYLLKGQSVKQAKHEGISAVKLTSNGAQANIIPHLINISVSYEKVTFKIR